MARDLRDEYIGQLGALVQSAGRFVSQVMEVQALNSGFRKCDAELPRYFGRCAIEHSYGEVTIPKTEEAPVTRGDVGPVLAYITVEQFARHGR